MNLKRIISINISFLLVYITYVGLAVMANLVYIILPITLGVISITLVSPYTGPDLPPGPYCGLRNECCTDRQDSCSHEILGTLCYCDEHCNRTHDDCCPDYEEVCLGIRPTAPPEQIVRSVCERGQSKMIDCNLCVCDMNASGELEWRCEQEPCMMSADVLRGVSDGASSWAAANYTQFQGKKLKDGLLYKLGTLPLSRETLRMGSLQYDKDVSQTPFFDARSRWPLYVSPVVDQGWCGSDWAVVVAAVASDRYAIQSNGAESVILSPQTLLSCNYQEQMGCEGGHIDVAWNFVRFHGLVDEICFPYKGSVTPCPFKRRSNLIRDGCIPVVQKRTERYKVGPPGKLIREQDIMYDIMDSGPVHAIMEVYQDFFHYASGVYRRSQFGESRLHGLHSVRIVGWGEDAGDKYWIVANSWGTEWGENGYFRIARGTNESGIESFVVTVLPEVTEAYTVTK